MRDRSWGDTRVYLEGEIRRVPCPSGGAVKQEKLPWLANNPFDTRRFAFAVGRRCRSSTILDLAPDVALCQGGSNLKRGTEDFLRGLLGVPHGTALAS